MKDFNIKIAKADSSHIEQLTDLWHKNFGDSLEYIKFFMKNKFYDDIQGNFGFGCMRFPMKNGEVDREATAAMVDEFINAGFNYFDTAHGYLDEQSEKVLRKVLVDRYPRESYILVNKLSNDYFKKQEDIRPFFEKQLEICGVTYFDFYLMHITMEYAKIKRSTVK